MSVQPDISNEPTSRDVSTARAFSESTSAACIDRDTLHALDTEWRNLDKNCIEENAYYSHRYARALLDHIDHDPNLKAIAVRSGGHLAGLLPYVMQRWRWGGVTPLHVAWRTPFSFSTTPLLQKDVTDRIAKSMIEAIMRQSTDVAYWLLPLVNLDGAATRALTGAIRNSGLRCAEFDVFQRPVLNVAGTFENHMKTHVSANRRRGLSRRRRKLAKQGRLEVRSYRSGSGLDAAIETFLAIEQAGWKGRAGTALACHDHTRAFARQAFGSAGKDTIGRADILYFDDTAIAASLAVQTGSCCFMPKATFDEAYRQCSPGLLLDQDILQSVMGTGWAERLDSSASGDHVLQSLWNGSVRVGDLVFCADPDVSANKFQSMLQLELMYRKVRASAKHAYHYLKGR